MVLWFFCSIGHEEIVVAELLKQVRGVLSDEGELILAELVQVAIHLAFTRLVDLW